jgi:hypothetical protein
MQRDILAAVTGLTSIRQQKFPPGKRSIGRRAGTLELIQDSAIDFWHRWDSVAC